MVKWNPTIGILAKGFVDNVEKTGKEAADMRQKELSVQLWTLTLFKATQSFVSKQHNL